MKKVYQSPKAEVINIDPTASLLTSTSPGAGPNYNTDPNDTGVGGNSGREELGRHDHNSDVWNQGW